jgi:hypothetical protein
VRQARQSEAEAERGSAVGVEVAVAVAMAGAVQWVPSERASKEVSVRTFTCALLVASCQLPAVEQQL